MARPSQVFMGLQVPTSSIVSATCWLYFSIPFPCVLIHTLSKVPHRCACQRAEAAASLRGNYGRRMLRCLSRDVSMACSSGTQWYEVLCGPEKRSNMIKAVPITKLKCISMLLKKKFLQHQCVFLKVNMANRPLHRHYTDIQREWRATWR